MTTWSAKWVHQLVQRVGWTGEDATYATALAMAASAGQDHYRQNPTTLPHTERQGLFALRSSEVPDSIAGADLFHPETNAQVAHTLWIEQGNWQWHPVHLSGAGLQIHGWLGPVLRGEVKTSARTRSGSFAEAMTDAMNVGRALRETAARLSR